MSEIFRMAVTSIAPVLPVGRVVPARAPSRKSPTAEVVAWQRSEAKHVEGVLGQGHLRVGHRLAGHGRSRSTNLRAVSTGTSVSFDPWSTKKGGASAWTRYVGEALPKDLGVIGLRASS